MADRTTGNGEDGERLPDQRGRPMVGPDKPICATCGTAFPPNASLPATCATCADERQYVPAGGQAWTSAEALRRSHRIRRSEIERGLYELIVEPAFAVDQRALLLKTEAGNVLWDELWRKLGDGGLRRAAYRGGCRSLPEPPDGAIRR